MSTARGTRDALLGGGVLALLLAWLIRQIVEAVAGSVREASAQSVERTMAQSRAAQTDMVNAFETMTRAFTESLKATVLPAPSDPPPQNFDDASSGRPWFEDPAFDPSAFGIDPTDHLIGSEREDIALVEPGTDILAQLRGPDPHLPGASRPDLAGETLG